MLADIALLRAVAEDGRGAAGLEQRRRRSSTGTIVRIDDSIASRWGPRVVNFVRAVAAALAHLRR